MCLIITFVVQVLISWECTVMHGLPWEWVERWLGKDTAAARFMASAMVDSISYQKRSQRDSAWVACDPIAVAAACNHAALVTDAVEVCCPT